MIDAAVTQHLISLGIAKEANPLMLIAMQSIPHGMWVVKVCASIWLLFLCHRQSLHFLVALSGGMCAVTAWNCMLLAVWYAS